LKGVTGYDIVAIGIGVFVPCMGIIQIWAFMKLWSCFLSPLRQIDEHLDLPTCIWSLCAWFKVNEATT
jgi:hypothetical protein